ncbi:TetR/AcrR family transcriptional regulator [uncultured Clostridium sp.]|uniref:TetR/AcrR family transcriptional regulator n=1 Tax=uncultured Clostridium sp. TaxID=59620 RepID=UPI0028F1738D|nr:TetR/AcrR family transcriptional regulator [uncultured Clostridium sp.]
MKKKILETVSKNIENYGLKKITLDLIASELKISKKTIYKHFSSKDEMIKQYIKEILENDKNSTILSVNEDNLLNNKINNIIYSYHEYKLPTNVIEEIKMYYPDEWNLLNNLKEFKVQNIIKLLEDARDNGEIRSDVDLNIVSLIIEKLSEELLINSTLKKYNFKLNDGINEVLDVILNGILKK